MLRPGDILVFDNVLSRHIGIVTELRSDVSWCWAEVGHLESVLETRFFGALAKDFQKVWAYRDHDQQRAGKAAELALAFVGSDYPVKFGTIGPGRLAAMREALGDPAWQPPLGSTRGEGMRAGGDKGLGPPFQFDALVRMFKWLAKARAREPFSRHRGSTCVTFVAACHQAAGLELELARLGGLGQVRRLHDALQDLRGPGEVRRGTVSFAATVFNSHSTDPGVKVINPGHALRENCNRGMSGRSAPRWPTLCATLPSPIRHDLSPQHLEKQVSQLLADLRLPNFSLGRCLDSAMQVDAKYLGPDQLVNRLAAAAGKWQRVQLPDALTA